MSRSDYSCKQKGGIAVAVVLVIIGIGLIIGLYLVSQSTSWFSEASTALEARPVALPSGSNTATPRVSPSPATVYENPFEESSTYQNPFEEGYENPFNSL